MKKICIIGNNAHGQTITDGGRIKIRLYAKKIVEEGAEVHIVDLDGWKKHILKTVLKIRKEIKICDRIIIMAGPNGCRKIIPIVNFFNRKKYKCIVFCPLGIGTLDVLINKLTPDQTNKFMTCENFFNISDDKMKKHLEKININVLQNEIIRKVYQQFYGLKNCYVLENFRDAEPIANFSQRKGLNLIYLSRVNTSKGIFDLLEVVEEMNKDGLAVYLDIYGEIQLDENEKQCFAHFLDESHIFYKGKLGNNLVPKTINKYDIFCFPTKYHGEGTPGVLIESFFAGTPCLISSYSQANLFVEDNRDGFIFKINDKKDLKNKLIYIFNNKNILEKMRVEVLKKAARFTYNFNRETFISLFIGEKK